MSLKLGDLCVWREGYDDNALGQHLYQVTKDYVGPYVSGNGPNVRRLILTAVIQLVPGEQRDNVDDTIELH